MKIGRMTFNKVEHTDMVTGKRFVSFVEDSPSVAPFQIVVSKEGLQFKGDMEGRIVSEKDLQDFAQFLGVTIWPQKRKFDPKIETNLAGH